MLLCGKYFVLCIRHFIDKSLLKSYKINSKNIFLQNEREKPI